MMSKCDREQKQTSFNVQIFCPMGRRVAYKGLNFTDVLYLSSQLTPGSAIGVEWGKRGVDNFTDENP